MRVMIIRPAKQEIVAVDTDEVHEVYGVAGLEGGHVDHDVVRRGDRDEPGLGIFVNEWSLMRDQNKQSFFILNGRLYGGNAVIYGFNETGETVDVPLVLPSAIGPVRWLANQYDVEAAIRAGEIERPTRKDNGRLVWRWPERYAP